MSKQTAVQYLKKMVFPYLSHDQKMITGQFFYEAEMMEKEQIKDAWLSAWKDSMLNPLEDKYYEPEAEQFYNEKYGKSNS
jgi:hypothetical protein